MQHIFNIAIEVDDDTIQKKAVDYCQKKLYEDIKQAVIGGYYCSDMPRALRSYVNANIKDFLEENRSEIIEGATASLSERLIRSKAVKDSVSDLIKETGDN